jgi:hypothetical protein
MSPFDLAISRNDIEIIKYFIDNYKDKEVLIALGLDRSIKSKNMIMIKYFSSYKFNGPTLENLDPNINMVCRLTMMLYLYMKNPNIWFH